MRRLKKSRIARGACFILAPVLLVLAGGPLDPAPAQQQIACDFLSGAGRINATGSGGVVSFGLAGGIKQGTFWGHLAYLDSDLKLTVESMTITKYLATGPSTRVIEGMAKTNLYGDRLFRLTVTDNGEPGRNDTFRIELDNDYSTQGTLVNGSVALLKGNRNSRPPPGFTCGKFSDNTPKGQTR